MSFESKNYSTLKKKKSKDNKKKDFHKPGVTGFNPATRIVPFFSYSNQISNVFYCYYVFHFSSICLKHKLLSLKRAKHIHLLNTESYNIPKRANNRQSKSIIGR